MVCTCNCDSEDGSINVGCNVPAEMVSAKDQTVSSTLVVPSVQLSDAGRVIVCIAQSNNITTGRTNNVTLDIIREC